MRKIEEQMIQAIRGRREWKSGNTTVRRGYRDGDPCMIVYLHGNCIAHVYTDAVTLSDAGWQTITTKSRLNAIAREFDVMGVYQKAHVWYFDDGAPFENNHLQTA